MAHTKLSKGVVECSCGSASFVIREYVAHQFEENYRRMTKNWDLNLRFEGWGWLDAIHRTIYCAGCGDAVSVSPAVQISFEEGWTRA